MSYVYILTNEAMPGYIKIGLTDKPVSERVLGLDNTSVAIPFQCYYAARVDDNQKIEKALHTAFGDFRVRSNREFFKMDPYKVKVILEVHESVGKIFYKKLIKFTRIKFFPIN